MGFFSPEGQKPPIPLWVKNYVTVPPEATKALENFESFSKSFTPSQWSFVGLACATSFFLGMRFSKATASFRRFNTVSDVHSSMIGPEAPLLRGRVVSVSDGDTFRLLHVPTSLFHSSQLEDGKKLSDSTLQIRICTIDTPETAKFGKSGQPFGDDAKKHLESMILDRMVNIQLLQKDQYGRGVAEVSRGGPFFGWPTKFMDEQMLKAGLAEVYQGGGAVYGRLGKDKYLQLQEQAEKSKMGMWSLDKRESAAEYKARIKAEKK